MRRLSLLPVACAGAMLLITATASASTICVNAAAPCDSTFTAGQLQQALTAAGSNGTDDTVKIGAGTYTGAFTYSPGGNDADVIAGAGRGLTEIDVPNNAAGQIALDESGAHTTVQDLDVRLSATNSTNDSAIYNGGGTIKRVNVIGNGSTSTLGITLFGGSLSNVTVAQATSNASATRAVFGDGNTSITNSSLTAATVIDFSGPNTTLTVARTTITAGFRGAQTDGGTINVDDSVIDLGANASSTGLLASNPNNGTTPLGINARHVTIVGGGSNSRGVVASASASGAKQTVTVTLADSIISGPTTPLFRAASNGGGLGGSSTANLTTTYSDYNAAAVSDANGANGAGALTATNQTAVAPGFIDPATGNYHLTAGSPLIDAGDPAAGGPAQDLDGNQRVVDGNNDFTAGRDIGAFERPDTTPPDVQITSGPPATTADSAVAFTFASPDPSATFTCRFDSDPFAACSGPGAAHTQTLANGTHTFEVRATDVFNNSNTASQAVTVDTPPPDAPPGGGGVDTTAPKTTIAGAAKVKTTKKRIRISFTADDTAASFECKLDSGAFTACSSPYKTPKLKPGKHTVMVRATDAAGNVETTPPVVKIRVKARRR
jgi:hypothetical protein